MSILLLQVHTLLFEASDKQTPFLIFPREKINIRYAGSDSIQMYIQGNKQRTNELNFFRKLVQKTGNIYYAFKVMPYLKKVSTLNDIYALQGTINNVKNNRNQFLNAFIKHMPISESFNKIASNVIKSTAFTDSLLLYYNNRELLNKQKVYKKLIIEKLATLKKISFMPYQTYYRACTTLAAMLVNNSPDPTVNSSNDFIKRFDSIEKNFAGQTKDFLMVNTLFSAHTNNITVPKVYINKFNSECVNPGYKTIINKKLNEKQTLVNSKTSNNLLFADGKTVKNLRIVISKHKGKVIVLDFWASWCAPCRAEMPSYNALKKKYNSKNIIFLSLSTDTNVKDWLKANEEESLENNYSFLLLTPNMSTFVKQYNVNSIPRYILIGKNGKIINDDAPRPSDPKLKELIDKNL